MNIAVIGAGNVGQAIGRRWKAAGHQVTFGVRDTTDKRYAELAAELGVADIHAAIGGAAAVLIAIPGAGLESLLREHKAALDGKLIFDATNAMAGGALNQLRLYGDHVPKATPYRAFNTLGWENFANPVFGQDRADLFYCGPDGASRGVAERLISDVGLRPVYVGGLDAADAVDGVARLWFALVMGQKRGRHLAFKVLARDA